MQIEKGFVLSNQEKEVIRTAANILSEISDSMNDGCPIVLYSDEYGHHTYSRTEVVDLADYLYDFTVAKTITEKG